MANQGGGTRRLRKSHLNSILIYLSLVFGISEGTASVEMSHCIISISGTGRGEIYWRFPKALHDARIFALKSLLDLA